MFFKAISEDSTQATVVYNNCTDHMTSSNVANDHAGNPIGSSITLSPYGKIYLPECLSCCLCCSVFVSL